MNFFNSKSSSERHKIIRWKAKALVLLKTLNVASESKYRPKTVLYGKCCAADAGVGNIKGSAGNASQQLPRVYFI